jgi:hypothetical protein
MKTKTFDCVDMKRRGAEHVYSIIKNMTPSQELEFWRERIRQLKQEQSTHKDSNRAARTDLPPPQRAKHQLPRP